MHSTAGELWRTWTDGKVLQPEHYDRDVADLVRVAVGSAGSSGLAEAMDAVHWTPRQLLHAMAPALVSFSGMMQDLLTLYAKIGARSGTGDNLLLRYEFTEDDPFDQLLSHFREQAAMARTASRAAVPLAFNSNHAWANPARGLATWDRIYELTGTTDVTSWPFAQRPPAPAPTGDEASDQVIGRGVAVVDAVLDVLAGLGPTTAGTTEWLRAHRDASGTVEYEVAQAATDVWPMSTLAALHGLADAVRAGLADPVLVEQVGDWLDGFWSGESVRSLVEDVADVLAMPTWGKRHELYSAWITAQLDQALPPDRLDFVVERRVLRFPFKATRLADLATRDGAIELWCELRSALADPVAKQKRSGGIQPDYRFLRPNGDPVDDTVLAVEVKHYLRSASGRHAETLTDYAAGLPRATVLLVGHGPLGLAVGSRVPAAYRPRIRVHEHVRPDRPAEAAAFRAEVARLLPPPPRGLPTRIELRWDPAVHDLDLYVSDPDGVETSWNSKTTRHSELERDAFNGGPEIIEVFAGGNLALDVAVHLYSSDVASVRDAAPLVRIGWRDGSTEILRMAGPSEDPRWWRVCRLEVDGRVKVGTASRVAPE